MKANAPRLLVLNLLLVLSALFADPTIAQQVKTRVQTFRVGNYPLGLAFDGANIWTANGNDGTVTKLRASDGELQGTFQAGHSPSGIVFDGTNIWVSSIEGNKLTKLRASDGEVLGQFLVGPFHLGWHSMVPIFG